MLKQFSQEQFCSLYAISFQILKELSTKDLESDNKCIKPSKVLGTRHGFDIVPCFILSYAWWYIFPQLTIRILFHLSPDDILDIFLIFLTMCLMIHIFAIFFLWNIFAHPTALLKSLLLPELLHWVSHVLHKDVHLKMFIEKNTVFELFLPNKWLIESSSSFANEIKQIAIVFFFW